MKNITSPVYLLSLFIMCFCEKLYLKKKKLQKNENQTKTLGRTSL